MRRPNAGSSAQEVGAVSKQMVGSCSIRRVCWKHAAARPKPRYPKAWTLAQGLVCPCRAFAQGGTSAGGAHQGSMPVEPHKRTLFGLLVCLLQHMHQHMHQPQPLAAKRTAEEGHGPGAGRAFEEASHRVPAVSIKPAAIRECTHPHSVIASRPSVLSRILLLMHHPNKTRFPWHHLCAALQTHSEKIG